MEARLFCATCWSNMTRLFMTPIIGRSATTVVSSWIDMLAGLSMMYCLRTPPCFWASAVGTAEIAIRSPAAIARLKDRHVISVLLRLLSRLSARRRCVRVFCLFVEPDVFHAPAVVDAVDHRGQPLHLRSPADPAAVVVDDRSGAVLGQFPFKLPDQLFAPVSVGFHRLP